MNAKKCDVCGKFFLPYHDSDYGKVFNRMNILLLMMITTFVEIVLYL